MRARAAYCDTDAVLALTAPLPSGARSPPCHVRSAAWIGASARDPALACAARRHICSAGRA